MAQFHIVICQQWNQLLDEPDGEMRCFAEARSNAEARTLMESAGDFASALGWEEAVIALTTDDGTPLTLVHLPFAEALPV